jgi:hypothetical protein
MYFAFPGMAGIENSIMPESLKDTEAGNPLAFSASESRRILGLVFVA